MKNYIFNLLQIFAESKSTDALKKQVHHWLASTEHEEEKMHALHQIWNMTSTSDMTGADKVLHSIYGSDAETKPMQFKPVEKSWNKQKRGIIISMMKYAAVVVLLLSTYYFTRLQTVHEFTSIAMVNDYTPAGEIRSVVLPDGSEVMVNAETQLIYPEKFVGTSRTVFLHGEAKFKVKPNPEKPFIVRSNNVEVTALGTEFNVNAYSDSPEVVATLLQGKVKVLCESDGIDYILLPGEQITYDRYINKSTKTTVETDDVTAWTRGELVFRSVTLIEMFGELQRRYGVEFVYDKGRFDDDMYNFRFSSQDKLTEVLDIMKEVIGNFEYTIQGTRCVLK